VVIQKSHSIVQALMHVMYVITAFASGVNIHAKHENQGGYAD
jgi:hypothetical protein